MSNGSMFVLQSRISKQYFDLKLSSRSEKVQSWIGLETFLCVSFLWVLRVFTHSPKAHTVDWLVMLSWCVDENVNLWVCVSAYPGLIPDSDGDMNKRCY